MDYVTEAEKCKVQVLGFSDHIPFPDNRWAAVRMTYQELPEYLDEIEQARKETDMVLLKGAECEWVETLEHYYKDELYGRWGFDYLIGSAHYLQDDSGSWLPLHGIRGTKKILADYTDHMISLMQSGYFDFVAHPDLFGLFYHKWDDEAAACTRAILDAAEAADTVLELNGYGLRKKPVQTDAGTRQPYPLLPFWDEAAGRNIRVLPNSDAHRPQDVGAGIRELKEFAAERGLRIADLSPLEHR